MKTFLLFAVLFLNLVVVARADSRGTTSVPDRSPEFTLSDQFDRQHVINFPRNKATVLVVADHPGSKQLKGWITPIYGRYQKTIDISGVADLGPVPNRLRKFVQSSFKKESDYPVMLDWSGKVAASFAYIAKKANLYVISPEGKILMHFAGPASEESHAKIFKVLDEYTRNHGDIQR